ncbi:hypothetical protein Tco_0039952 [Tanacetum coccineum]
MGCLLFRRIKHSKMVNYGEEVVIEEGKCVEGPMMIDLIRLRSSLSGGIHGKVGGKGLMALIACWRGKEDDKELVVMGEVGGPMRWRRWCTAVAGVDRDRDAEKEETGRIS